MNGEGDPRAQSTTAFEVRCPDCRVSFPVGTRRCIHCGERLGRRLQLGTAPGPGGIEPMPAEEPEEEARPRRLTRGIGGLWLFLALAGALYRACTGG